MQYVSVRLNLRPEVQPLFTSNSQLEKDNIPPTTTSLYSVMFPSASLTTFHRYFGAKSLKISKVFQVNKHATSDLRIFHIFVTSINNINNSMLSGEEFPELRCTENAAVHTSLN